MILTELAIGMRLAFAGDARGWTRSAMAAAGVTLGTALLLLAASVPVLLDARGARLDARNEQISRAEPARGDTLLYRTVDSSWNGLDVRGRLIWPESAHAPLPPGVAGFPADGQMYVSPALRAALAGPGGGNLRRQIPYGIAGTIAPTGLSGPQELAYYAGYRELANRDSSRLASFGRPAESPPDHGTYLMVAVLVASMLLPVAIFIAAALRFGADSRDRRLAAIRLAGADYRSIRRIAVGESMVPALLGLVAGAALYLLARGRAGGVRLFDVSVYPADIHPVPVLALLVVVGVFGLAAAMTLVGIRGVRVEPLGVVRSARVWRGRLWWRLLLPAVGLLLISPALSGRRGTEVMVGTGVIVLIIAVIPLVPYLVPAVASLLPGGPVSWQLASGQLRQNPLASTRAVTGVVVAVTGAIALHTALAAATVHRAGSDSPDDPAYSVMLSEGLPAHGLAQVHSAFAQLKGVRTGTTARYSLYGETTGLDGEIVVGDCSSLGMLARLDRCADGDAFTSDSVGRTVTLAARDGRPAPAGVWTVPPQARRAMLIRSSAESAGKMVLLTVGAAAANPIPTDPGRIISHIYPGPDAPRDVGEQVRAVAASIDPLIQVTAFIPEQDKYAPIRTGVNLASTLILLLMGVGLLLDVADRLHDRRRLFGVLAAVGANRFTVVQSVLLQAVVPMLAGLALAIAVGVGLGAVLMRMSQLRVGFDAAAILAPVGAGVALVLLSTTVVLVPAVGRVMRTEELRYE